MSDSKGAFCDVCEQEGHKPYVRVLVGTGPHGAIIETWPRRRLEMKEADIRVFSLSLNLRFVFGFWLVALSLWFIGVRWSF